MLISTILYILLATLLASLLPLLTTRVTEKPIRIPFTLIETGANTFTTTPIQIPSVPSITLSRGDVKAIGVEVMKVYTNMAMPDSEDGQSNSFSMQIHKGAAVTAFLNSDNNLIVHERRIRIDNSAINGSFLAEASKFDDLTDGDGNGELVLDDQIHLNVLGVGNAAAKSTLGWLLVHLVEFDAKEAVFEILETAQ